MRVKPITPHRLVGRPVAAGSSSAEQGSLLCASERLAAPVIAAKSVQRGFC